MYYIEMSCDGWYYQHDEVILHHDLGGGGRFISILDM